MRSQLPGYIAAELLDIIDSRGEKQIYRILNELETGTEDILREEGISRVSWLSETHRSTPVPPPVASQTMIDEMIEHAAGTFPINYRQPYRVLPAEIQHEIDAPNYWKVIDHVHRQASRIGSKLHRRNDEGASFDDLAREFAGLVLNNNILDPADRPDLFGHDWLTNFRLGAAGELFVS